jgi:hypothetical protein
MSISNPYFVLDIPTIEDIQALFQYRYFTRGETVYPGDQDSSNEPRMMKLYGIPRRLKFEISHSLRDLSGDTYDISRTIRSEVREILTANNLSKAEAEAQLQTKNASRLSFSPPADFLSSLYAHPSFDSANDNFDFTFNLLNNVDEDSKVLISTVLENSSPTGPIIFNPSTNLPIVDFDEVKSSAQTSTTIMDFALGDAITSITADPLSSYSDDFSEFEPKAHRLQSDARGKAGFGTINLSDYAMAIEPIDTHVSGLGSGPTTIPVGFIFYKTRVEGAERIVEAPIILVNPEKKTVYDNSIIYGATYEYSVHTLALCQAVDEAGRPHQFFIISKDGKKLVVECEERKPPATLNDINFQFLDSTMMLNWQLPIETSEKNIPINDIKYVQVFKRLSLHDPFELIRMFDFNDSEQVITLEEQVPTERVVFTHQAHNYLELSLPEKGENVIYAAATVDAHGNSSFLSAQYEVYLDSLTQPKIKHVAYPGAPKQYPNLTLLEDAFVDSIKASDYNKLTIYHNPDFTILLNGKNEQKLVSTDKNTASYMLQLIDVETQKDERINIFMRTK